MQKKQKKQCRQNKRLLCWEQKSIVRIVSRTKGVCLSVCGGGLGLEVSLRCKEKALANTKYRRKIGLKTRLDRHCVDIAVLFSFGSARESKPFFTLFPSLDKVYRPYIWPKHSVLVYRPYKWPKHIVLVYRPYKWPKHIVLLYRPYMCPKHIVLLYRPYIYRK